MFQQFSFLINCVVCSCYLRKINACSCKACYSSGCGPVSYTYGSVDPCAGGVTYIGNYGTVNHSSQYNEWYAPFISIPIVMENGHITWNTNLQFNCNFSTGYGTYDARTVIAHEMGHSEGLGHTGFSPTLMESGTTCCYTLQSNDINGLQNIYPGHYPA